MRHGRSSTGALAALATVVAMGCSARVASEEGERPGRERERPGVELPDLDVAQAPLGDPGPTPEVCIDHPVVGAGTTWLDASPASAEQRHLRCLSQATPELSGRFVHVLHETNLPAVAGSSVEEPDRIYDYPLADRLANQPAAYYLVTEMALEQHAIDSELDLAPLDLYTGPFFMFDSFYTAGDSITLGRAGLPGNRLDVHIAGHEYAHHLIGSLAPGLLLSTLHEGMADFLSCVFTGDTEFMRSLPIALQRPCDNDHRWPIDVRNTHEACELLADAFETAGWADTYDDELETIEECLEMPPPYPLEGHLTGMIVSGALWSLHLQIGESKFPRLLFEALRLLPAEATGDFGMFRQALLEADEALHGGAHALEIDDELGWRGIGADVGLAAMEQGTGYACLMTPEHQSAGRLPAGPLLPVSRMRRGIAGD